MLLTKCILKFNMLLTQKTTKYDQERTKITVSDMLIWISRSASTNYSKRNDNRCSKRIPIPGANVVVKGTKTSTSSDFDGKYSISVPNQSAVLVFSYVGSAPQEIAVGSQTTINAALGAATQQLER